MALEKTYKRGDTGPPAIVTCLDGSDPVDLTSATSVKFLMGDVAANGNATVKVNGVASFAADRTSGNVIYNWGSTDLNTAGIYKAEVEVTWTGGQKQTFPAGGYLTINVVADIG